MTRSSDQLVFVPLGGLGEIGMNAALYGFGPEGRRKWILVDCGLSFAGPEAPGVDIVLPDLRYIIEERANLLGIVITHAHEDHIGALAALWPSLRAPVYCTRFAAGLLATRRLSEPGAPKVPMHVVAQGGRVTLGPFDIEFVPVAHSIPESNALAIRTPVGLVVHTGDWKIDPTPQVGLPTDEKRLRELGDEGVLALICDSTNVMRDGTSPSEADVAAKLKELVHSAPGRVAVTTFASNVARLRAVAEAAIADQREVVVVGRAMDRVIDVARECGYLDGIPAFRSADTYGYLPRDKVVALLTGSQGEPRAALSRIASDDHPEIALSPGDRVIFSSRTIPGNEKSVGNILNALARDNIEIITDRTHLVHVSGHPRREEMARLYGWLKPKIVIPAHGEDLHLSEHATFARGLGVKTVVRAGNGDVVAITAEGAGKIDEVTAWPALPGRQPAGERAREDDSGAPPAFLRRHDLGRRRHRREGRPCRRSRDRGARPAALDARRHRFRRIRRRRRLRADRRHSQGAPARPRGASQRAGARPAQRRQRGVGQEAAGACAGD